MAHDQRYCIECGARRGPLPTAVAERLATILERGSGQGARVLGPEAAAVPAARPTPALEPTPGKAPWAPAITLPTPRAAAAGILAMLAFGVLIGSFGKTTIESLASSPLLVLAARPSSQAPGATADTGSAGSSGSSQTVTQTVTTITQTASQPSSSGSAASNGAGAGGGGTTSGNGSTGGGGSSNLLGLPPIHHVFLIVMSDQGFGQTFGPGSPDPYLSNALPRQGELIQGYYAVAGSELANRVALISGQGPTKQTAADCPTFAPIKPATKHALGQVIGSGCVYPSRVETLAGELAAAHKTWKAYIEGIERAPHGQSTSCRHPKLGASGGEKAVGPNDPYVTWTNPFVYFSSVTGQTSCQQNDVSLDRLTSDLKSARSAPAFAYITPSACDNGSDTPCAPNSPAGLKPGNAFLKKVVTEIKTSAAYKDNGLIAITFDEAPQSGPHADPSACCNTPHYPNLATSQAAFPAGAELASAPDASTTTTSTTDSPGTDTATTPANTTSSNSTTSTATATSTPAAPPVVTTTTTTTSSPPPAPAPTPPPSTTAGTTTTSQSTTTTSTTTTAPASGGTGQTTPTGGGGQVGLLLISPYVKPGTSDLVDYYNHFSLLATIENLFSVKRLGYASDLSLPVFDAAIFNGHP
jgi:hypothetical protein